MPPAKFVGGMFALLALLFVALILTSKGPERDPRLVFGCFTAAQAAPIQIDSDGLRLSTNDGIRAVPFELEYHKGYEISLGGSYELRPGTDGYEWAPSDRGWSYLLAFVGPETFSGDRAHDATKLMEFNALTSDRRFIRFRKTDPETCAGS